MPSVRTVDDVVVGCNINKPIMEVYHSGLQVYERPYKCTCPACGVGLLLVARHPVSFHLCRVDRCTLCGQVFKYLDDKIASESVVELEEE